MMHKPDLRYLVLWLFLFGIIIIVFLQVISGYNIKRLIQGNKSLMSELQLQNTLRKIETDVLTVESDIRGAVISGRTELLNRIPEKNRLIAEELRSVEKIFLQQNNETPRLDLLKRLIAEKQEFGQQVIEAFQTQGKTSAESVVNTNRGNVIRDSIITTITYLEKSRQSELTGIVRSIESTGRNARLWGFIITAMALAALISAFWFISNQGKQQQKMIQALNESERRSKDVAHMKEQFLANMSHEIRTPMNSILGFTSLLRRTDLSPVQREYVQNIHSAGDNLLTLVNDILDLSKIEAGMLQLEETRFSLRSMISSVGAMFIEKVREKNLGFHIHIDKEVPDILSGDAVRLTQIMVNLISNAVKFTERGDVVINVEVISNDEHDVRIRICVSDTGIGIALDKQKTVFERFQQAEAETTRRFGGTGLGLSIVKQLVDMQKGTISLWSEPGKGSKFTVELTFRLPDIAQLYSEALAEQQEQVPLQMIKVLIAEDNLMNQQLIRHLMKSWTIDFIIVNSGKEAVEELKHTSYSIVLMDIQMPEMDGYTATSMIRNELKLDVPIIAMTAHAMVGEKEKCLQLGMNDYVSKPIKETVLYNIIARHAQHIQHQPEPSAAHTFHHIRLEYLHQLSGNDPVFEKEILQQFLVQAPEELTQLEGEIENNDFDQVRRTAHSLKSTVGYVGLADELHPFLEKMERDAMQEDPRHLQENLQPVKEKCRLALTEVKTLLENGAL